MTKVPKYSNVKWKPSQNCIITQNTTFDSDQKYILEEMKRLPANIHPVMVIDQTTGKVNCHIPNESLTGFDKDNGYKLEIMRLQQISKFFTNKSKLQMSGNVTGKYEKIATLNYMKNQRKIKLLDKDNSDLEKEMKKL